MGDLALRQTDLQELTLLGDAMVESGYFKDLRMAQQAIVRIIAGREFGMGPVEAMSSFHVIKGKVELTADALAARVKASARYDYNVLALSDTECILEFFENGRLAGVSSFTEDDREKAGLQLRGSEGPTAWARYPRNMLFARALTNGVAWYCPDIASAAPTVSAQMQRRVNEILGSDESVSQSAPIVEPAPAGEPDGLPGAELCGVVVHDLSRTLGWYPCGRAAGHDGAHRGTRHPPTYTSTVGEGEPPAVDLSASGETDQAYGEGVEPATPEATTAEAEPGEGDKAVAGSLEAPATAEPCTHPRVKPSPVPTMARKGWVVCLDCPRAFQVASTDPRWPGPIERIA